MDLRFKPEEEEFRMELREFIEKEVPERWKELHYTYWEEDDESWEITKMWNKKLAEKGWYALTWPKEFGGSGKSEYEKVIFDEEMFRNGTTPTWMEKSITIDWVGPTIMLFGNQDQKDKYLSKAAAGELYFCLGYSEPDSGSDLGSIKTTAIETDDAYIVNGQKIWTTQAHRADYIWLAARTDLETSPQKGISMLIVDLKSPGITIRPIENMLEAHSFNEVFFDNVKVPKENLVGKKNNGWYQMMKALTFERGVGGFPSHAEYMIGQLVDYCNNTSQDGEKLSQNSKNRDKLARLAVEAEAVKLLNYRSTSLATKEKDDTVGTSITKVLNTRLFCKLANTAIEIMGPYGQLDRDSKYAPIHGEFMRWYLNAPSMGLGAGTTEVQMNIIAQRGLGLPVK